MNSKAYLGITGCDSVKDIDNCILSFRKYGFVKSGFNPMLGFLISYKAFSEDFNYPLTNKFITINKAFELLSHINKEANDLSIFKTIHYNTHKSEFSQEIINLLLSKGKKGTPYEDYVLKELTDGIQLNIDHPDPFEIYKIKERFPDLAIIFQFSEYFLDNDQFNIYEFYKTYAPIDYILIDTSKGTGEDIDLYSSLKVRTYRELFKNRGKRIIGFAGGFNGDNILSRITRISDLIGSIEFSIDAEGRLRNDYDLLDPLLVDKYISNFLKAIRTNKK